MKETVFWQTLPNSHRIECVKYTSKYIWNLMFPYDKKEKQLLAEQDITKRPDYSWESDKNQIIEIAKVFLNESIVVLSNKDEEVYIGKRIDAPVIIGIISELHSSKLSEERDREMLQEIIDKQELQNLSHFYESLRSEKLDLNISIKKLYQVDNPLVPKQHIIYVA